MPSRGVAGSLLLPFSNLAMSDSLWPYGLQHTRPPCPSPSPGVCPSSFSLHQWCHPVISSSDTLFSFCPQSFPASGTFPMMSVHIRCPKHWSFSFTISPFSEYSGLISLKIDWFDLLAVQGTFKSLLQHYSSKASILWPSAFFTVHVSQLYTTTGKTTDLTIQTFVSRVMSLLFNILSRFVIAFLPRSNHLLISWLRSLSTVILEPKKRKSVTTPTFSPSICHTIMGMDAMFLIFIYFLNIFSLQLTLSLSSIILIKRLFRLSLLSAIKAVSSAYLRLLMLLLPVLILACNSSSPAFLMMCLEYGLNNTADSPVILLSRSWANQLFHTGF